MANRRKKEQQKVISYRRKAKSWNIGSITFVIILIYSLINIFLYFNRDKLIAYEVKENKIQKTITTTGIALRSEQVIKSKSSGYLCYYAKEGSRIAKESYIYSIDETGNIQEYLSQIEKQTTDFNTETYLNIHEIISNFHNYYNNNNFYEVYDFKYDLNNAIMEVTNEKTLEQLEQALKSAGIGKTYKKMVSPSSGFISYVMDGYEDLTEDKIERQTYEQGSYQKIPLKTVEKIPEGTPVYKLITGDEWDIVIPITQEQKKELEEKKVVPVNFLKDDTTLMASVSILDNKDGHYAKLHFTDYMIRYINDRFLNVEIVLQSISGLKIPNSSLTTCKLYRIPISYLTYGKNSSDEFFNVRKLDGKGNVKEKLVLADYVMKDSKYCYVSTIPLKNDSLQQGDILIKNNSNKTFKVSATKEIQGVYCVNKGYAAFKVVNVLYSSGDYSIVEEENDVNSLMIYDHIILNSHTISENEKIY